MNAGKSGLQAERVRAFGALCSLWSNKQLAAEKQRGTHFICIEEKETLIEDYVERETAGATKWVEDAQGAVQQEQNEARTAENAGLTNREPEKAFREMMVAIGDSLSDRVHSDDGEDREDEDDQETEQGQLSEDDKPGWAMGTITKTVQHHMGRYRQKQMKLDELTQLGSKDAADYFSQSNQKYGTTTSQVTVVVQLQTDDDAVAPGPTTIGE